VTPQRYKELETDDLAFLTDVERAEGWHWCPDWDYMLIGPNSPEMDCCTCPEKPRNNEFSDGNGY